MDFSSGLVESLSITSYVVLAGLAFVAGFVDAIAGGGGLLTVPALLAVGVPPHLTLGTNKLSATAGSAMASLVFIRRGMFNYKLWTFGVWATAIGAVVGALVAMSIPGKWLERFLPIVVILSGLYFFFAPSVDCAVSQHAEVKKTRQIPQGIALGFYDGISGPGTGTFWTVSSLMLYPLGLIQACGVARTMNFVSNVVSLVVFIMLGNVIWLLGLLMGGCVLLGSYFGANTAIKNGNKLIRPIFLVVVLILSVKLVWQYWF